jgi:hypothetical protein
MDRILASASNAESQNRLALRRLIDDMIQSRIGKGGGAISGLLISGLRIAIKSIFPEVELRTRKLKFESPQENKMRLEEEYRKVSLTINRMPTRQMFQLIAKLKQPDLFVDEVLKSIPTSRYVLETDGSVSVAGNKEGERKRPTYSLDEESR